MNPYEKRRFYGLSSWSIGDLEMKVYGISAQDEPQISADSLDAAQTYARALLPAAVDGEGGSEGVGYVVLHKGNVGTWLLLQWWAHGDICCQRMALAREGSSFDSVDDRPLLGCVWEQVVMQHECDAYVRHVLSTNPSRKDYLTDVLADGLY